MSAPENLMPEIVRAWLLRLYGPNLDTALAAVGFIGDRPDSYSRCIVVGSMPQAPEMWAEALRFLEGSDA